MTTDKRAELEARIQNMLNMLWRDALFAASSQVSKAAVVESAQSQVMSYIDQYTTTVAEEAERRGETSALEMQKLWAELHGFTGKTLYSGTCHVLDSIQQFPDQPLASHTLEQLNKSTNPELYGAKQPKPEDIQVPRKKRDDE